MAVLPAAASVFFAVVAIDRARLPYNSEGRYFDAANSVVYHDGAQIAYGAMAIGSLATAAAVWFGFGRLRQSNRSQPPSVAMTAGPALLTSSKIEYLVRASLAPPQRFCKSPNWIS